MPISYRAAHSDFYFNFIGNFDESKGAGLLHIAYHYILPRKISELGGNSAFGKMRGKNPTHSTLYRIKKLAE